MKSRNMSIGIWIIAVVIFCAVGFFAGMKYEQRKGGRIVRNQFGNRTEQLGRMGGINGNRQIVGEITAMDDASITIKSPDGSSRIIFLTGTTSVNKAAEGTKADLAVGMKVAVFGTENSNDKTVTATNIQINPMIRGLAPNVTPTGTK